jgi:hypothetical protein
MDSIARPRLGWRRAATAIVALLPVAFAGCGGAGPASPSPGPTTNRPDAGECIDLTGPDDDLTMTVVDCAVGAYEVLHVISILGSRATCPPANDFTIERSIQFLKPGQTPGETPGGMTQETYCLRELAPPGSAPGLTIGPSPAGAADVEASDVTYTSKTQLGDAMTVELTLTNSGDADSGPMTLEIGGLSEFAVVVGCTPECAVDAASGDYFLTWAEGLAPDDSNDYEVELDATASGTVEWTLTVIEGRTNDVFRGTAKTTIE